MTPAAQTCLDRAREPEIYRQPLFPPAALRPWSRPLLKPRVSKSPRLTLSKSSVS